MLHLTEQFRSPVHPLLLFSLCISSSGEEREPVDDHVERRRLEQTEGTAVLSRGSCSYLCHRVRTCVRLRSLTHLLMRSCGQMPYLLMYINYRELKLALQLMTNKPDRTIGHLAQADPALGMVCKQDLLRFAKSKLVCPVLSSLWFLFLSS